MSVKKSVFVATEETFFYEIYPKLRVVRRRNSDGGALIAATYNGGRIEFVKDSAGNEYKYMASVLADLLKAAADIS
jgi:hypothetical protein